jgi:hypothetical protein
MAGAEGYFTLHHVDYIKCKFQQPRKQFILLFYLFFFCSARIVPGLFRQDFVFICSKKIICFDLLVFGLCIQTKNLHLYD